MVSVLEAVAGPGPKPKPQARPRIIIVGANKGGVGKTTVSRVVLDVFRFHSIQARAIDTQTDASSGVGVLHRFFPESELIDISDVDGQMATFDDLAPVTLIDIRAGLLLPTLEVFARTGLMDAIRAGEIDFTVMHVVDTTVESAREVSDVVNKMTGMRYVMVRNHRTPDAEFAQLQKVISGTTAIDIPYLKERAAEAVDMADATFLDFIARKTRDGVEKPSFILSGWVRDWFTAARTEIERGLGLST